MQRLLIPPVDQVFRLHQIIVVSLEKTSSCPHARSPLTISFCRASGRQVLMIWRLIVGAEGIDRHVGVRRVRPNCSRNGQKWRAKRTLLNLSNRLDSSRGQSALEIEAADRGCRSRLGGHPVCVGKSEVSKARTVCDAMILEPKLDNTVTSHCPHL